VAPLTRFARQFGVSEFAARWDRRGSLLRRRLPFAIGTARSLFLPIGHATRARLTTGISDPIEGLALRVTDCCLWDFRPAGTRRYTAAADTEPAEPQRRADVAVAERPSATASPTAADSRPVEPAAGTPSGSRGLSRPVTGTSRRAQRSRLRGARIALRNRASR
jgi:hypothetical protein